MSADIVVPSNRLFLDDQGRRDLSLQGSDVVVVQGDLGGERTLGVIKWPT
jgi:hypothetical protein